MKETVKLTSQQWIKQRMSSLVILFSATFIVLHTSPVQADSFTNLLKKLKQSISLGGSALSKYTDPGPDLSPTPSGEGATLYIGQFNSLEKSALTGNGNGNGNGKKSRLAFPLQGSDIELASVQGPCFEWLKNSYQQRGFNLSDRKAAIALINDSITMINGALSGKDPAVAVERMSTVYGSNSASKEQEIRRAETESKQRAIDRAMLVAVAMVTLNPNSRAAGKKAIHVIQTAMEKSGVQPTPIGQCTLAYLRDRYGDESDEEVMAMYVAVHGRSANRSDAEGAAATCPVALSLATKYIELSRFDDAFQIITQGRNAARMRFGNGDMRSYSWPIQSCRYVSFLEGVMYYQGVGVKASPHEAADSFRQCADGLDVCAYNVAYLVGYGETQASSNDELGKMLQVSANSNNAQVRSTAREMLSQLEQQVDDSRKARNEAVCRQASANKNDKDGSEPTEQEMCYSYIAYADELADHMNNAPSTLGSVAGISGILNLAQALQGGKVSYVLSSFDKDSCRKGENKYECAFDRTITLGFQQGPLARGLPMNEKIKGTFSKTSGNWRFIQYRVASTPSAESSRTCLDSNQLNSGELAAGAIFGGSICY